MERGCTAKGKKRYWLFSAIVCFFLSGCAGTLNAGTTPATGIRTYTAHYYEETEVSWFDGEETQKAAIVVSKPGPEQDMDQRIKYPVELKEGTPDMCSRWFCRIDGRNRDVQTIRPIYAGDKNGHTIIKNNQKYNTAGIPVGDNWYLFYVPNGTSGITVSVGNCIFSDGGLKDPNDTDPETETGAGEDNNEGRPAQGFLLEDS